MENNQAPFVTADQQLPNQQHTINSSPDPLIENKSIQKKSRVTIAIAVVIAFMLAIFSLPYFLDIFAGPGVVGVNQCLADATEAKELTIQKMESISSREERVEVYCADNETTLNKLKNCLETVKQKNSLSMNIFGAFPKISKNIQEDFDVYNSTCTSKPIGLE